MKTKSKLVLILYIVAALLGVAFIIMFFSSIAYIREYTASYGMSVGDMMGEAVSYVLSSSISYLIYGILVFIGARVLDVVQSLKADQTVAAGASAAGAAGAAAAAATAAAAPLTEVLGEAVDTAAAAIPEEVTADVEEVAEPAPAKGQVPPLYTSRSIFRY